MNRDDLLAVVEDRARNPWALTAALPMAAREIRGEARTNPTCGDRVELALSLDDEDLDAAAGRDGDRVYLRGAISGCALSTAAGDILAEVIEGRARQDAARLVADLADARLRGRGLGEEASAVLSFCAADGSATSAEDLRGLATMEVVPLRRRCIAFPWKLAAELLAGDKSGR